MEYKGEDFYVDFPESGNTVEFNGTIRLRDKSEYQVIADILDKALETVSPTLILDLKELSYLNSSGINMFSKFIITAKHKNTCAVEICGSSTISWQQKSLKNLRRIWPEIKIEIQ